MDEIQKDTLPSDSEDIDEQPQPDVSEQVQKEPEQAQTEPEQGEQTQPEEQTTSLAVVGSSEVRGEYGGGRVDYASSRDIAEDENISYEETEGEHHRGGYAEVRAGKVRDKTVWIVLVVMILMCFAVAVCSSVLTAHFMRSGEKPIGIITDGDPQQNVSAVVSARKNSIAEVRCGTLNSSAIVMKRDGSNVILLTNAHAIASYVNDRRKPIVRFYGEDSYYEADVVGYDGHYDVAVLRVAHITTVAVTDLDGSAVFSPDISYSEGDYVVSIGNGMGMGVASYAGIVSKKGELLECSELFGKDGKKTVPVFRTTAVINAGMSGGGVFDMKGNLIGLGTYRMSNSAGVDSEGGANTDVEDTGFATPMSIIYPIYRRILSTDDGGQVGLFTVRAQKVAASNIGAVSLTLGFTLVYQGGALVVDTVGSSNSVTAGDRLVKIGDIAVTEDVCEVFGAFLRYHRMGTGKKLVLSFEHDGAVYNVNYDGYKYAA